MVYTFRFCLFKMLFFHNSKVFGFCIIHILYTGCAKIKKKTIPAPKVYSAEKWREQTGWECAVRGSSWPFVLCVIVGRYYDRNSVFTARYELHSYGYISLSRVTGYQFLCLRYGVLGQKATKKARNGGEPRGAC